MYTERDMIEINARIRRNWLVLAPVLAALAAVFAVGLARRVEWLAMAGAGLLAAALCFGITFFLLPNGRYRAFLTDMQDGLSREMTGRVVSVAEKPEMQDGARVLPVHILLAEEQDERIVYLNASKADRFPPVGTDVRLSLYGRHIKAVD